MPAIEVNGLTKAFRTYKKQPGFRVVAEAEDGEMALGLIATHAPTVAVLDLNMPVEIVGVPTVRDEDGLAKSSRNRYLSPEERTTALTLSRALFAGQERSAEGADAVRDAANAVLEQTPATGRLAVDYLALVDPRDFSEVPSAFTGQAVLAVAARVGTTRLIDNLPLTLASLTSHGAR